MMRWQRLDWQTWPTCRRGSCRLARSGGWRCARLALSTAPLWLLDEPTVGLDAASMARVGAVLLAHRARDGVVVAATHVPLPLDDVAELRLG